MKSSKTSKRVRNSEKETVKPARESIDSYTFSLVSRTNGVTYKEAVTLVTRKFPKRDSTVLALTTARRLKGYLSKKYNVRIESDDSGRYKIVRKKRRHGKKTPKVVNTVIATPSENVESASVESAGEEK
jgi:hypothetical protein